MACEIIRIGGEEMHVRLSGVMKLADQHSLQIQGTKLIDQGKKLRILITLENFEGWERSADWGDVSFLMAYGNEITKIAVVGDEQWMSQVFAFLGKGFRATEVEFFPPAMKAAAETWLHQ